MTSCAAALPIVMAFASFPALSISATRHPPFGLADKNTRPLTEFPDGTADESVAAIDAASPPSPGTTAHGSFAALKRTTHGFPAPSNPASAETATGSMGMRKTGLLLLRRKSPSTEGEAA